MSAAQAVILAAGAGTRMKSSTPKVLHPLCGRPMIAYALDVAAGSGVKKPIVVVNGHQAELIKPHLPKEATLVIQQKPLGTGDAVLAAKRALGGFSGDLLVLYADTPLIRRLTIQRLIEAHRKSNATCTLLTTHLADPAGYGRIVRDAAGLITGIVEEADANTQQRAIREVNVGPLCVKTQAVLAALATVGQSHTTKEWYLTQAISALARQEGTKFQTIRLDNALEALGVNSRTDLVKAAKLIRLRLIDHHLQNGVTVVDPETTFIDHGVTIGQDTVVWPGTVIESGVTIGKRCTIGPFARLRRGVSIGDDTRVGNFVELVRATIGSQVRVNHVTYLGDTTVDDQVNIGAGTITANFDGADKHATAIGKGAFIGCDTVLIAPVTVGPGAVTGAGSVIPKGHDVPPKSVVLGVPAHVMNAKPAASKATINQRPKAAARTGARSKSPSQRSAPIKRLARRVAKAMPSRRSSRARRASPSRRRATRARPR